MDKTYEGLKDAIETANTGLVWLDLLYILGNDPIVKPYYFEVVDLLVAGRNSLRFEK